MRSMMSRQAMEQALGKLVIDVGFRDAFFRDPMAASEAAGIELSDEERDELGRIRPGALAAFQRYLDAKHVGTATDLEAGAGPDRGYQEGAGSRE